MSGKQERTKNKFRPDLSDYEIYVMALVGFMRAAMRIKWKKLH
jgi:hypothetical protein